MSLDGLRAWIGEVERKLGMRTRVFLVLTVIAIGGAGAGIYLAIDARDSSVSESDVQALQEDLEARIGEGGGSVAGPEMAQLEAELKTLQAEVAELKGEGDAAQQGKGTDKGTGGASSGAGSDGDGLPGSTGSTGSPVPGGAVDTGKLQELLDQAREQSEENE